MNLLALETATEACSVALWIDGALHERFDVAPRRHAELVLPWASQLLADAGLVRAQLDAIAVGRGPGAFTGVRLAISFAQGIALALDRPVVAVSTLAALAMRARPASPAAASMLDAGTGAAHAPANADDSGRNVLAAIDARMGEVYLAGFRFDGHGLPSPLLAETLLTLGDGAATALDALPALADGAGWHGVGTGFGAADGVLVRRIGGRLRDHDATALPHAADVARLAAMAFARGEHAAPDRIEPAYLRNKVALTLAEQGRA